MAMKQRYREFLLQRADLSRYGGLRQSKLFAGMRETAGLGCMAALEAERFLALRASDRAAAE